MLHDNLSINGAGHLCLAGADTVALAREYGTPLYLLDEARIRQKMRIYADSIAACFPEGSLALFASQDRGRDPLCRGRGHRLLHCR